MFRTMLKSKIHRATVTKADVHSAGSLTLDEALMEAADLLPGEQVAVVDATNGARLQTYVVAAARGGGAVEINGAAAHLVSHGDVVIIISYAGMEEAQARSYRPKVVFVDADNKLVQRGADPAEVPVDDGKAGGTASPAAEPAETVDAAKLDELISSEPGQA